MDRTTVDLQNKRYLFYYFILQAVYYGGRAFYYPYIGIYYGQIGYSVEQIGILQAIGPIATLIFAPMFGYISDKFGRVKIFRLVLLATALLTLLYPISTAYMYVLPLTIAFAAFNNTSQSMLDGVCLEYSNATRANFPVIRLMGTLGFALVGTFSAYVVGAGLERYFQTYAIAVGLGVAITFLLPKMKRVQPAITPSEPVQEPESIKKSGGVMQLLKNKQILLLLGYCLITHIGSGFFISFNSVYMKENLISNDMIAMIGALAAVSEIPVFLFFNKLVARFGEYKLLLFCGFMTGIRMLMMFYAHSVGMFIFAQMLQGISFIGMSYSAVAIMNNTVPREFLSTGQTALAMIGNGLAYALGSWLGGSVSNTIGLRDTFLILAIMTLMMNIVVQAVLLVRRVRRKGGQHLAS